MKTYILLIGTLLYSSVSYSQKIEKDVPLFRFLQKNADSTIVIQGIGSWIEKPILQILSKKGDTVTMYTYKDDRKFKMSGIMPTSTRDAIYAKNRLNILSVPVDVNIYFNSRYLSKDSLTRFWEEILKIQPWQIKDDSVEGPGCPVKHGGSDNDIYDGGATSLTLITKNQTEQLYFYAPRYYEELCPGRAGRKAIIVIWKLFGKYFKEEQ